MRPTQRLQQWCCGRAWQLADFSLPPPPSLQQWIISPAEWEGGKRRAAGGSFRVQGFLALSPLWQFPPSTWPVSARQTSAILCSSRSAHVTLEEFGEGERLFLAFRSCGKSHVYILCLQTCYDNFILKSWSLETWLCVFFLPFSKSCADLFHT